MIKASDDNSGISAYCINTINESSSCEWKKSSTNTYTYDNLDFKTYYVFVKDNAENISNAGSITVKDTSIE